jgi:prenyltransferase beta subunit
MRKHDVNYHEKTNIIKFYSEFCTHSKRIKITNKEKNIHFEKESFLSQSDHFKFDDSTKNSKKFSMIVIKILSRKEIKSDQSAISFFRKDKNTMNEATTTKSFTNVMILVAIDHEHVIVMNDLKKKFVNDLISCELKYVNTKKN